MSRQNQLAINQNNWTFPDWRQLTFNLFEEEGKTPGDIRDIMDELCRSPILGAEGGAKACQTLEFESEEKNADKAEKAKEQEEKLHAEQQKQQEDFQTAQNAQIAKQQADSNELLKKQQEQKQLEEKQLLEKQLEEKRIADAKAAENRPAEDRRNMSIAMLPLGLAGLGLGLGLSGEAMNATAAKLSDANNGLSGSTLLASNSRGKMLEGVREALKMPALGSDSIMTGPDQAMDINAPQPPLNQPGQKPGTQPGMIPSLNA